MLTFSLDQSPEASKQRVKRLRRVRYIVNATWISLLVIFVAEVNLEFSGWLYYFFGYIDLTVLLFPILICMVWSFFIGLRYKGERAVSAILNGEPFLLYLRSFRAETSITTYWLWNLIMAVGFILFGWFAIPVLVATGYLKHRDVSVMLPALEELPPIAIGSKTSIWGVPKLRSSEENWKQTVLSLVERAAVIVFSPIDSPGTRYEIEFFEEAEWQKTILLQLPRHMTRFMPGYKERWNSIRCLLPFGNELPDYSDDGSIVIFTGNQSEDGSEQLKLTTYEFSQGNLYSIVRMLAGEFSS